MSRLSRIAGALVLGAVCAIPAAAHAATPQAACDAPVWTDSASDANTDFWFGDPPYILAMGMWNAGASPIHQTMKVCDHASWHVVDRTESADNTAVLVYSNVHVDYIDWGTGTSPRISSFASIDTTYSGRTHSPGDWEFAYDIWVDGFGAGNHEVMIWTENHGQTPAGTKVAAAVSLGGRQWDLYATADNRYLAFVPSGGAAYRAGTLPLKRFFTYLMSQQRIAKAATLSQIDYGVEICNTGGVTGDFQVTRFAVDAPRG